MSPVWELVAFSEPYLFTEELVIQRASTTRKISSALELPGRVIHAWKSSSHYQTLERKMAEVGPFEIVPIPPRT